jgi:crotonobetainyl-CoA:carnitine CoA-transferase CaiB-like acyl-CoA transferase
VQWVDDPIYGDVLAQGPAYKLSDTPPRVKWTLKPVGTDNEKVYASLAGKSVSQVAQMEEAEVI